MSVQNMRPSPFSVSLTLIVITVYINLEPILTDLNFRKDKTDLHKSCILVKLHHHTKCHNPALGVLQTAKLTVTPHDFR